MSNIKGWGTRQVRSGCANDGAPRHKVLNGQGGTMKAGRSIIGPTIALLAASALLVTAPAASASPPSITAFGPGTGTAPLAGVCTSPVTVDTYQSSSREIDFFDNSGHLTAIVDTFNEVDTFIGPTEATLVGDPYHGIAHLRFDSSGNVTSESVNGVLEKFTLPDGTPAVFAGKINLLTGPTAAFVFIPDNGHSSNLAGFCAALDAGQPAL